MIIVNDEYIQFKAENEIDERPQGLESVNLQIYRSTKGYFESQEFLDDLEEVLNAGSKSYDVKLIATEPKIKEYKTRAKVHKLGVKRCYLDGVSAEIRDKATGNLVVKLPSVEIPEIPQISPDGTLGLKAIQNRNELPEGLHLAGNDIVLVTSNMSIKLLEKNKNKTMNYKVHLIPALVAKVQAENPDMPETRKDDRVRELYKAVVGEELDPKKKIRSFVTENRAVSWVSSSDIDIYKSVLDVYRLSNRDHPYRLTQEGKVAVRRLTDRINYTGLKLSQDLMLSDNTKLAKGVLTLNDLRLKGFKNINIIPVYKRVNGSIVGKVSLIKKGTVITKTLFEIINQYASEKVVEASMRKGVASENIIINPPVELANNPGVIEENVLTFELLDYDDGTTTNIYLPTKLVGKNDLPEAITYEEMITLINIAIKHEELGDKFDIKDVDLSFEKKISSMKDIIRASFHRVKMARKSTSNMDNTTYSSDIESSLNRLKSKMKVIMRSVMSETEPDYLESANIFKTIVTPLKVRYNGKYINAKAKCITYRQFNALSPYSTPVSSKIGMVRSICKYVKLEDNKIKVPYYKVHDRIVDTSEPIFLERGEADNSKIAYLGTFGIDELSPTKLKIKDDYVRVMCDIANSTKIFHTASENVEYTTVASESILSIAESMIPCSRHDEGARQTYGVSQFAQAVNLIHPEVPYVITKDYRDMIDLDDYYYKKADKDVIIEESGDSISLLDIDEKEDLLNADVLSSDDSYEGKIEENTIDMTDIHLSRFVLNRRKRYRGVEAKKGEMIFDTLQTKDGFLSIGMNALVAFIPYQGYNHDDAFLISKRFASKMASHSMEKIKLASTSVYDSESFIVRPKDEKKHKSWMPESRNGGFAIDARSIMGRDQEKEAHYTYMSIDSVGDGDKFVGRHGNKGTLSKFFGNDQLPVFDNGFPVDIVYNQIGVYPRMNFGSIIETKLGLIGWFLDTRIVSNSMGGASIEEINLLMKYIYDLTNSDNYEEVFRKPEYKGIPESIHQKALKRQSFIRAWRGVIDATGKAKMRMTYKGKEFLTPITFGIHYVLKLEHIAQHGLKASSVFDNPNRYSMQPDNGQRIGEMELDCLDSYGAENYVREILNSSKSDNLREYRDVILNKFVEPGSRSKICASETEPYATVVLKSMLKHANIFMEKKGE